MSRLELLRAEIEFLERMHALGGKVGAQDEAEAANSRTGLAIGDSFDALWDRYNKLPELAPPAGTADKGTLSQRRSLLKRAFLLYTPQTAMGWVFHTLFYMFVILFAFVLSGAVALAAGGYWVGAAQVMGFYGIPFGIALFIFQRRARQDATRSAPQPEVPNP